MSRSVEGCVQCRALAGVRNLDLDDPSSGRPDSHCNFGDRSIRRVERRQHAAQARCCRCIDVAPTALPFNIKSATVGEGQTPVTLSCVEDDDLGEELRVLLAHSMRNGHHCQGPAASPAWTPSGDEGLGRGLLVG